jgi:phospholipid transport system transporter-binding protein
MAALPAKLTISEARTTVLALEAEIAHGSGALDVDASALAVFDTSAIATLLELRRQAQAAGRAMRVADAPPSMIELAGLYGVADLLGFSGDHSARA